MKILPADLFKFRNVNVIFISRSKSGEHIQSHLSFFKYKQTPTIFTKRAHKPFPISSFTYRKDQKILKSLFEPVRAPLFIQRQKISRLTKSSF